MSKRISNNNINKTIQNYSFRQRGQIFKALKHPTTTCPKLGQFHLCGKFHVRGWCTDDCDRKETHNVLVPEVEKKVQILSARQTQTFARSQQLPPIHI